MNKKQSNKMREIKDSGISLVGKIPQNWEIKRLKYLFKFCKGLPITKDNLIDQGLPVINYGQIHAKTNNGVDVRPHLLRFVDFSYQTFYPLSQVMRGDFVFADTSEDYEGCGNCVYKRNDSLLFAGYHTIIAHSIVESDNRFFAYLFQTDIWRKQIREKVSGVKVFSITQKTLSNTYLILPPLNEQQRIAEFLDRECGKIDGLKADIQAQIDTLEQYKRSVITEAVTHGLNPSAPMKDSGINYISEHPIHWSLRRLKYILNERNERSVTGTEELLSVSLYKGVIPSTEMTNRTMQADSLIGYKRVHKGDLVFNKLNPGMARFGCSDYDGITSPDFAVYIVNENYCNAKFLQYLLKTAFYVEKIKSVSMGVGDGFTRLYSNQLYEFFVALPPRDEVSIIINYLDNKCAEIEQIIADKKSQIETLDGYKKSLIYEYVTGKKEVG